MRKFTMQAKRRTKQWLVHRNGKTYTAYGKKKQWTVTRPDYGHKGRGSPFGVRIHVQKGKLALFGYSTAKSETARRNSLKKAIKVFGPLSIYRALNAQVVFRKNQRKPEVVKERRLFEADRDWIGVMYLPSKRR